MADFIPLPPVSLLALLRGTVRRRSGAVPSAALREEGAAGTSSYRMQAVDLRQLREYCAVLEFPEGVLPVTFYYLIAQRAHLAAMVDPSFPFRLAGMIHAENAITELAPLSPERELVVHNTLRIEPPADNGARYCVFDTVAEQDGRANFRCESRYLAVRGARRASVKLGVDGALGEQVASWTLPAYEGRLYAKASGDWNPIHLWPWSARLMGLKQPIIHGMHTVGKACAQLERAAGRRVTAIGARFLAPLPLGSEVRLEVDWANGRYFVLTSDRLAVEGSFVVL